MPCCYTTNNNNNNNKNTSNSSSQYNNRATNLNAIGGGESNSSSSSSSSNSNRSGVCISCIHLNKTSSSVGWGSSSIRMNSLPVLMMGVGIASQHFDVNRCNEGWAAGSFGVGYYNGTPLYIYPYTYIYSYLFVICMSYYIYQMGRCMCWGSDNPQHRVTKLEIELVLR